MYLSASEVRAGSGRTDVRVRSPREERHPPDVADQAERKRDRGNVEPRTPDRDGDRLPGACGRRASDAPLRGRGHVLAVHQDAPGIKTRTGGEPRVEGDGRGGR